MSDLKFPFKFRYLTESTVYKSEFDEGTQRVIVSWEDEDGSDFTTYPLNEVTSRIKNKQWNIIQPEPLLRITQAEYDALIDEIDMLRELLAEAYKPATDMAPTFKPISEMTMEDWKQAKEEGWVFETRDGEHISVVGCVNVCHAYPIVGSNDLNYTIHGEFYTGASEHKTDIIKRIQ